MIEIYNASFQRLCVLPNTVTAQISEEINREYTLDFTVAIDTDMLAYVSYGNYAFVEGTYFRIVYSSEKRTSEDLKIIQARCNHASFALSKVPYTMISFAATGTPAEVLGVILADTPFLVGQVDFTTPLTISINQETNKRAALVSLVGELGGELRYRGMYIDILTRRGANRGCQFRYGHNLNGAEKTTDGLNLDDDGNPTITYNFDPVELEYATGYGSDEHYELGDDILCFDPEIGINGMSTRITKYTHNVNAWERGRATVTCASFLMDLQAEYVKAQTIAVKKDSVYNGCSIGPDRGFQAEMSNKKAKANYKGDQMAMYTGDGEGAYTPVFYIKIREDGVAELWLDGNVVFTGTLQAATGTFAGMLMAAGGTFSGNLVAENVALGNGINPAGLYLNIGNGRFIALKSSAVSTGGATNDTLIIGKSTSSGGVVSSADRVDIFSTWLYLYGSQYIQNNLQVGGNLQVSGSITSSGDPLATQSYVQGYAEAIQNWVIANFQPL